jgi:hypothetical protein
VFHKSLKIHFPRNSPRVSDKKVNLRQTIAAVLRVLP